MHSRRANRIKTNFNNRQKGNQDKGKKKKIFGNRRRNLSRSPTLLGNTGKH
jgi:hypothetical protein